MFLGHMWIPSHHGGRAVLWFLVEDGDYLYTQNWTIRTENWDHLCVQRTLLNGSRKLLPRKIRRKPINNFTAGSFSESISLGSSLLIWATAQWSNNCILIQTCFKTLTLCPSLGDSMNFAQCQSDPCVEIPTSSHLNEAPKPYKYLPLISSFCLLPSLCQGDVISDCNRLINSVLLQQQGILVVF